MTGKERAAAAVEILKERYPDAECSLSYKGEAWRLLVMAILSAQCTDARVNIVSAGLFEKYPDPGAMADADIAELEELVRPCGFFRNKAKNIKACCAELLSSYGGKVPDDMEELLRLPGVGRKIANLILGDVYGKPAVVTDTHCIRISERIGLTAEGETDPYRTEKVLVKLLPPEQSSDFCHRLVLFGREICTARSPRCDICPLYGICRAGEKKKKAGNAPVGACPDRK